MGRTRRRTTVGIIAVVGVVAAAMGSQLALAQGDEDAGASDEALLERLDGLEPTLPDVLPEDVELDDEETWGTVDGDFVGAATTLETVEDELSALFRDADDAEGVVAEAVSNVARGWLDLGEAYEALGEWESGDLAFPVDTEDDLGVATGADEDRGHAERGLRHVLRGQERHLTGYVTLREEGAAPDPEAQARLDTRASAAEEFDAVMRPLVQRLLSLSTTMVMVPAERFETDAPGVEARARSFTVTCVDREAYLELQAESAEGAQPSSEELSDLLGIGQDRIDCPDLPDGEALDSSPAAPADEPDED